LILRLDLRNSNFAVFSFKKVKNTMYSGKFVFAQVLALVKTQ